MAEYITKKSVADALFSDEHMDDVVFSANHICRIVANLPATDVRPVVRCKNCIHHYYAVDCAGMCRLGIGNSLLDDDFCSRGADMRAEE